MTYPLLKKSNKLKTVYADNEENLTPDGVKLLPMIPFSKKHALGKAYSVPVLLQSEHGKR